MRSFSFSLNYSVDTNTCESNELQHNARPTECAAQYCQNRQGRMNYTNKNGANLLVLCKCCGSKGVHRECRVQGKRDFLCDDCDYKPSSKRQKTIDDDVSIHANNDNDMNNNVQMNLNDTDLQKIDVPLPNTPNRFGNFVEQKFKILLPGLQKIDVPLPNTPNRFGKFVEQKFKIVSPKLTGDDILGIIKIKKRKLSQIV